MTISTAPTRDDLGRDDFRHEALLYAGSDEFLEQTSAFIRGGLEASEPTLVVVAAEKIRALSGELGPDADQVCFRDMAEVGENPARIIPAWRAFVDKHARAGTRLRGIGEPVWAERSPAELVECQRHESLLNVAFEGSGAWWLLCPYDTKALDPEVIDEAERSHPFVAHGGEHTRSAVCRDLASMRGPFDAALPPPPVPHAELAFDAHSLPEVRRLVRAHAERHGLDPQRCSQIVIAAHEIAANSVRHGGGRGVLRVWGDDDALVCEATDAGHIDDPLVGRVMPPLDQPDGRGVWLANHLCDLVQLRTVPEGTVVRLHMRRGRVVD